MKTAARLSWLLLLLGVPFLWQSSYEIVVLTVSSGPQNVFFSIAHTAPGYLMLVLASGAFSLLCTLILSVVAILTLLRRGGFGSVELVAIRVTALFLVLHAIAFLSYGWWAPRLAT